MIQKNTKQRTTSLLFSTVYSFALHFKTKKDMQYGRIQEIKQERYTQELIFHNDSGDRYIF